MSIPIYKSFPTQQEWFKKETGMPLKISKILYFPQRYTDISSYTSIHKIEMTLLYRVHVLQIPPIHIDSYRLPYKEKHSSGGKLVRETDYLTKPSLFAYVQEVLNIINKGLTHKEMFIQEMKKKYKL